MTNKNTKTPEQIADEIVLHIPFTDYQGLSNSIARAIQAERARKIPWPTYTEVTKFLLDRNDHEPGYLMGCADTYGFLIQTVEKKMNNSNLLDCPFCGSNKPRMRTEGDNAGTTWKYICCDDCGARTRGKWFTGTNDCPIFYTEVRNEWNIRRKENE